MNGFATRSIILPLLATSAALSTVACGGSSSPIDGEKAYTHVAKMVSFGPRPPGSEALAKCGDYIVSEVEKVGLTAQEQRWSETVDTYGKPTTVALRNIWTEIPGDDPENGPILLLAAHYDSKLCKDHPIDAHNFEFVGAIDGGGASGLLLELARVLQARQAGKTPGFPPISPNIWIVWFDGEECLEFDWLDHKSLLGSRHFAKSMGADKTRFPNGLAERMKSMVLMDLIGDEDIKIDKDTRSNGTLIDIFGRTAEKMGEAKRMYKWESPMTDDHVPFKNLGVTVIDLIDFRWRTQAEWDRPKEEWARAGIEKPAEGTYNVWWHKPDDTMQHVRSESLAFVGNLVWHALSDIEKSLYGR